MTDPPSYTLQNRDVVRLGEPGKVGVSRMAELSPGSTEKDG